MRHILSLCTHIPESSQGRLLLCRTLCSEVWKTLLRRRPSVVASGWRTRGGRSRARASGAMRSRYVVMHADTHVRAIVRTARSCNELRKALRCLQR